MCGVGRVRARNQVKANSELVGGAAVPTHFVECVQMAACVKIIFPELMQEVVNCAVKNDACRNRCLWNARVDIT